MTTVAAVPALTMPKWPLFLAPFVALIYYAAIQDGFAVAIRDAIPNARDLDELVGGYVSPKWGTHWIYRAVSEAISLGFATFIAGGMARGRARTAALIGGLTISLFYLVRLGFLLWAEQSISDTIVVPEPWYQYLIEGCVTVAAPLIGVHFSEAAEGFSARKQYGFGGIPRAHFLWL